MNKPAGAAHRVLYIGSEKNYFNNIVYRYKNTYGTINWEFQNIEVTKGLTGESIFLALIKNPPKILYIDFCSQKEEMFILSELLSRDPLFEHVPLVGLTDKKEAIKECLGVGIDFMYVKGGEFFDLVHAPMVMAFPKQVKPVKFAKAKLSREVDLIDDFRVGYIAPTYMHVEGNLFLEEGTKVRFNSEIPTKNIPSKNFIVKNRSENNLYYDFNYSYDLDFVFVDEPDLTEDQQDDALGAKDEAERLKVIKKAKKNQELMIQNYKNDYIHAQKKHKEWVINHMDLNLEKKTKLMVVDKNMRIFSMQHESDFRKKYSFRCFTQFDDNFKNSLKIRPSIIVYQLLSDISPDEEAIFEKALEKIKSPEVTHNFEDKDQKKRYTELVEGIPSWQKSEISKIQRLITEIKSIDNYSPIIVLFNCFWQTSKSLQESFMYPMIVTYGHSLNMDVVMNLAQIYEKRQEEKLSELIKNKIQSLKKRDPRKYGRLNESDFKEKKYFIKKSNTLSFGSMKNTILLTLLTESEVRFQTEIELPMKTYRLDYPLPMSINLVPIEEGKDFIDDKGSKTYRGIIHSISENDKKTLRQVVNDILFSPLNEKRAKEQEEFAELNQKVAQERELAQAAKEKREERENKESVELTVEPIVPSSVNSSGSEAESETPTTETKEEDNPSPKSEPENDESNKS
ncbi:MAG: hypothetical protein CME60_02710 [Halobacteriovoraceae bacterium]|nr:hypothetical protein [Halobacteriovoraceae bacterium]|tara:strand:- start:11474 stop:13516 length:2043 start_codon:yes stop_codon:yes gene_type:complete